MGLLDDLQKEVKNIRAQEIQHSAELDAQAEFYREHLRPAMVRAHEYFAAIVENLNIVAPDIVASYPLNPLLQNGITLKQSQYAFRSDNQENPRQIDIFCRGTLEKPHEFYLPGQQAVLAHVDLLDRFNFPYHRKNRLDRYHDIRGATFILEGPMIVHIRIAASPADRSVHFGFRNVERQPVKRYTFAPEVISEEFLERLAKVLIRQVPQLVEQKTVRDQLRAQRDDDSSYSEDDLTPAYAQRKSARLAQKNSNAILRTKRAVIERIRQVLKGFSKN